MSENESTEYKRLSVEEIQELAGETLPDRVALSLFNAGVGVAPVGFTPDDLVVNADPIKSDEEFAPPPGYNT